MPVYLIGLGGIAMNLIVALSVMIYTQTMPPVWLAYPLPPFLLMAVIGMGVMLRRL